MEMVCVSIGCVDEYQTLMDFVKLYFRWMAGT